MSVDICQAAAVRVGCTGGPFMTVNSVAVNRIVVFEGFLVVRLILFQGLDDDLGQLVDAS